MNLNVKSELDKKNGGVTNTKEFQWHITLDNLLEGVHIIGFDWKYLYANKAMLRDSNTTSDRLIGFTVMEKVPGIEKTDLFKIYENCMTNRLAYRMGNRI